MKGLSEKMKGPVPSKIILGVAVNYTLQDILNTIDQKGNAAKVAEILTKSNPILQDAPWMEANEAFGYKFARREHLPTGEWRAINSGVASEVSSTVAVTEPMGMLETYSEVDKALADNHPHPQFFRMINANGFIEGMAQTMAEGFIYDDHSLDSSRINGLAPRLADSKKNNVYDMGGLAGSTSLTSIYAVQWGPDKTFIFHPKNHKTKGVEHQDLAEVTLRDAASKLYQGYRDHFKIHCGLGVMDERSIARICNIDVTKAAEAADGGFKEDILIEALNQFPNEAAGAVIYVPRKLKTIMEIALKNKNNVNFAMDSGLGGTPLLRFKGVPVRTLDAIKITETRVVKS